MNYMLYSYEELLKDVIYGFSLIFAGILSAAVILISKDNLHRDLVLKSAVIILIIFVSLMLDKNVIISVIPHKITI